jgi:hypothetical protein
MAQLRRGGEREEDGSRGAWSGIAGCARAEEQRLLVVVVANIYWAIDGRPGARPDGHGSPHLVNNSAFASELGPGPTEFLTFGRGLVEDANPFWYGVSFSGGAEL